MFSLGQIAVSAVIGAIASFVLLALYARVSKSAFAWREALVQALVVGASILVWRTAGNTQALNDDPIPLVSPNDVLCPVLTYVSLGLYAGFRRLSDNRDWQLQRALLTFVSLVVNVVTI